MKANNPKEIERLFSELEKYGYVFPSCVRWSIDDLKCQAEDAGVNLDDKTDDELREKLHDIFVENGVYITAIISQGVIYETIKEEGIWP